MADKKVVAKKIGQTLVVSLAFNEPSLLWHLDLDKAGTFVAALHHREGAWDLGVTSPRGERAVVATFTDYEDAEKTLQAIQKALLKTPSEVKAFAIKIAKVVTVIALVALVAMAGVSTQDKTSGKNGPAISDIVKGNTAAKAPVVQYGVPQNADDLLAAPPQ